MDKKMLGVVYGSRSCEHEVSIISAVQLMRAVDKALFDVTPIYITKQGEWYTGDTLINMDTYIDFDPYKSKLKRVYLDMVAGSGALMHLSPAKGLFSSAKEEIVAHIDCMVPVLHGLHGEDGSLQGVFEMANIPYTSCGVASSAIGMDKIVMKCFFRGMGFPVLPDCAALRSEYETNPEGTLARVEAALPYPVFVKPACLGSSIGVSRADDREALKEALALAFSYDRRVLIEKGLDKPMEINCSVMGFDGEMAASVLEMPVTAGVMLDFKGKYLTNGGAKGMASLTRIIDPDIGREKTEQIKRLAKDIFASLDCKGVVRIDFMLDKDTEDIYITEINTIPGSMAYYLWDKSGVPYAKLIEKLVDYALKAQKEKDDNSYAFHSDILKGVKLGGAKGKLKL